MEKDSKAKKLPSPVSGKDPDPSGKHARKKPSKNTKKICIIAGCSVAGLLVLTYAVFAVFFANHFFFGTKINDVSCSGKTITTAKQALLSDLKEYTLTILEAEDKKETIHSDDIAMKTEIVTDLTKFKKEQNPLLWPSCLFGSHSYEAEIDLVYDSDRLSSAIAALDCMQEKNMHPAKNAYIEYSEKNKKYQIVDEKPGTIVSKEAVTLLLTEAVDELKDEISLRKEGCYQEPEITAKTESIKTAVDKLNTYSKSTVIYDVLGNKETVNFETFKDWLTWNESFEVSINSDAVTELVNSWASKYNTSGKQKVLDSSYGTPVTINKGSYGWKINVKNTATELMEAIRSGNSINKEPVYAMKAAAKGDPAKDYGNSYVEINLGTQHLFLYVNGSLVIETDFVSGKVTNGNATPVGIYPITYKQSPAVLRGANYASPVTYWMPFNGGVGMHDATWRSKFGGNIYYNSGSHGCINLPLSAAKTIYANVSAGMPVIVYDLKVQAPQPQVTLSPEEQLAADIEQPLGVEVPTDSNNTVDVNGGSNANVNPSTPVPTPVRTQAPTPKPTQAPTQPPKTAAPTPTLAPTPTPTLAPTPTPTATPTLAPTPTPTATWSVEE